MTEDISTHLEESRQILKTYGGIFDIASLEQEVTELEKKSAQPDFWEDPEQAQNILKKLNDKKERLEEWKKYYQELEDLELMFEMAREDEDQGVLGELAEASESLIKETRDLELKGLLSAPEDKKNAILTLHPGAGGTESQDWAQMLMRMFLRWVERHGFKANTLDLLPGEEAGIKSATIEIKGPYAYGYLKSEVGVHRLVRISPFDSSGRRHTSFASIFVLPEIDEDFDVEVNLNDLRIDTYRASGAGGQHVNRTDSAVRITHEPTGIVVTCQSERSQHKNKANAMKILKSRLYQKKLDEERAKRQKLEDSKTEIAWGNQIRSYVFHPYNMVKDHRTDHETGNVQRVMDGEIDDFIHEYLLKAPELAK
ncbi:peptide chain release factor 2 [Candidatus Saccharibacteria bacterium]|nr:peptide chain release factor 2 [Calditrichia bacterium]NIW00015.1 peptide chain release factor 2 [Candidatus Saccharibacteria bacterium]